MPITKYNFICSKSSLSFKCLRLNASDPGFYFPLYILDSLRKRKLLLLMMKVPQLFVWTIQRCFTCEKSIKYWHWFVFSEKKTSLNQVNKKNERDLAPWLQEVVSIYQFIKWNHFYQINLIIPNDSCPFPIITFGWVGAT